MMIPRTEAQANSIAIGPDHWQVESFSVDLSGKVLVNFSLESGAHVLLQVTPAEEAAKALVRSPEGDVSYREAAGVPERVAVAVGQAFVRQLLPRLAREELPHLLATPRAADEELVTLRLGPAAVISLLRPEIQVGVPLPGGQILEEVKVSGTDCVLVFRGSAKASPGFHLSLGRGNDGFRLGGELRLLALGEHGEPTRELSLEAARVCSKVAALLKARQAARRLVVTSVETDLVTHLYALNTSGFSVIREVLTPKEVEELGRCVDPALERSATIRDSGAKTPASFYDGVTYLSNRCLYCWGEPLVRLLESDLVKRVADAYLGTHKLYDMVADSALPGAEYDQVAVERWHRDFDVTSTTSQSPRYLWVFFPLDDFLPENGATWLVPGSHRYTSAPEPAQKDFGLNRFPSRVQILARAGDVILLDPTTIHTWGHNTTARPRRMVNLQLCYADSPLEIDHWAVSGPTVQSRASTRLRALLDGPRPPRPSPYWNAVPEGWPTGEPGGKP